MNRILFLLIFTVLIGCSPENDAEDELLVFAAASLANTISEIKDAFELQHKVRVSVNYGGSQLLAQQISSGCQKGTKGVDLATLVTLTGALVFRSINFIR